MRQMNVVVTGSPWALTSTLLLSAVALYALAVDQGFILSLFQGHIAFDMNLLHEFLHDARHSASFPCH